MEKWKNNNSGLLNQSLANMDFLDVFQSISMFAYHRPQNIYPVISADLKSVTAQDLVHPLLCGKATGNTISLGENEKLILLTGANMTGKSTWLRTVGLNMVIAACGLPVKARNAAFPVMRIYTSMRITDSLESGISYFRAELNRLKNMLDNLRNTNGQWLVLLDEPLRGTNSSDKQSGTIGLITNLLKLPALTILATHDAALCNLETAHPGDISNYHFDSSISGLELTFDYLLKPGCSVSNNATLLMKITGILD
jgi:DNA mismatch repair ATPase MutS